MEAGKPISLSKILFTFCVEDDKLLFCFVFYWLLLQFKYVPVFPTGIDVLC